MSVLLLLHFGGKRNTSKLRYEEVSILRTLTNAKLCSFQASAMLYKYKLNATTLFLPSNITANIHFQKGNKGPNFVHFYFITQARY